MTERPPEPEEAREPDEPTEVTEPDEATAVTEPEEPTAVTEPEQPTAVTEAEQPTAVAEREPPEWSAPAGETTAEETKAEETTAEETKAEETKAEETTEIAGAPREEHRLRRSRDDRAIAGVCGGLAKYLGIDAVLVRIAALLLIFAGGVGIVLYLIGWIAMPEEEVTADGVATAEPARAEAGVELERRRGAAVLGLVFVVAGIFFLLDEVWPDLSWRYVWPVALIAVGFAIVIRGRR